MVMGLLRGAHICADYYGLLRSDEPLRAINRFQGLVNVPDSKRQPSALLFCRKAPSWKSMPTKILPYWLCSLIQENHTFTHELSQDNSQLVNMFVPHITGISFYN